MSESGFSGFKDLQDNCIFYIYHPASYGSGKMPDMRRGDIVGFYGFPFNPTYVLPNP